MKVNHVGLGTALKFQWTYISSSHSSHQGARRENSGSSDESSITACSQTFPRSRFHHAACLLGKFVYIFGGKDRYSPLRDFWRFDTVSQEWEQVENAKSRLPHLQGHTMLAYKSQLLIFGGTFGDTSEDTPLWTYNTDLNYVHKFCCESFNIRPVGRREHSAVIYKTSMYIYGGFLDSSGSTDEFWAFSIEEEEWRMIRRHKPGKRHGHVAVVSDSKMWLHGGMRGLMALSDLWTFSFGTSTWNKVRTVGVAPGLSNHTAHVLGNSILLFGGSKSGTLSQDFWMLRFDTLTWRNVSTQNGDLCPPITLHTSVLLSSALLQSAVSDRTQSVPQLKGRPVFSPEWKSARPWTSPTVHSMDSELNMSTSAASHVVDILRLDTLGKNLDGNNNSSEEDILHMPGQKIIEAETSFFSDNHAQTLQEPSKKQQLSQSSAWVTDAALTHLACSGQQGPAGQYSEGGRLRSASAENCGDAVPLLSRFHSVTSEVDLGENNLTITLSDEEISDPVLPKHNDNTQLHKDNLSADFNGCSNSSHEEFRGRISGTHLNKMSEKEYETKNELFESLAMCQKENESEFASKNSFHCTDSLKIQSASADCSCIEMDTFKMKETNYTVSNSQNAEDIETNSFQQNMVEPFKDSSMFVNCFSNNPQLPTKKTEVMHPKLNCVSDLIIEDLESSDISEILHKIKISCPPRPYLRSSSLKDLYNSVNYEDEDIEPNFETCVLTKSQLTKSCGSICSWQKGKLYDKKLDYHKFILESVRDSSLEMQPKIKNNFSQNEANSGKYIKHVTSVAWRNSSHLPRSQGNLQKCPNSGKTSIGTQTSDSQTLLPDAKLHLDMVMDHFLTPVSMNTNSSKHGTAQSAQRWPGPVATINSIFMNTNVCILVIGGQTESHGFQTEPLKMWLCCLY